MKKIIKTAIKHNDYSCTRAELTKHCRWKIYLIRIHWLSRKRYFEIEDQQKKCAKSIGSSQTTLPANPTIFQIDIIFLFMFAKAIEISMWHKKIYVVALSKIVWYEFVHFECATMHVYMCVEVMTNEIRGSARKINIVMICSS